MRRVRTRVLPDPAPATTSSGRRGRGDRDTLPVVASGQHVVEGGVGGHCAGPYSAVVALHRGRWHEHGSAAREQLASAAMLSGYLQGRAFGERFGTRARGCSRSHGWGRSHADFAGVLAATHDQQALDAVALDLPGFGASPAPGKAWGAKEDAEFVCPLLVEMAAGVVIVGHSFGGRVAVELAAMEDDRVATLVLTGVPLVRLGRPPRPRVRYRIVRSLARAGIVGEGRLDKARGTLRITRLPRGTRGDAGRAGARGGRGLPPGADAGALPRGIRLGGAGRGRAGSRWPARH